MQYLSKLFATAVVLGVMQPSWAGHVWDDYAQYRKTVLWERYYQAGRACETNSAGNAQAYYVAAFNEAQKWFASHPKESLNLLCINDLDAVANRVAQPILQGSAGQWDGSQRRRDIYKKLWTLFDNALGDTDKHTGYYKACYQQQFRLAMKPF